MSTQDPFNMDYRLIQLEKWREIMDKEGLPKALALLEQARDADRAYIERLVNQLMMSQDKLMHYYEKIDERVDRIEEELDKRSGGLSSTKFVVTGVFVVLLLFGGFLLNVVALLQGS